VLRTALQSKRVV